MTHHSLYPAFVRINYTTPYAPHSMTLPTVPITFAVGDGTPQFVLRGLALPVSIASAVAAYVALVKTYYTSGTTFTDYVAFTMATTVAPPLPVAAGTLGTAGTGSLTTDQDMKATQATWTFRTDAYGIFKIVMLDTLVGSWDKITNGTLSSVSALVNYVTSTNSWLAGRDGGRPVTFLQEAFTMNERLRRSYRMN